MIDIADQPATAKRRIAPYLLVGVVAVVLNALGVGGLDVPIPLGAASGLAWTLLAIPVARAVNRRGERLGWLRLPGWAGQAGLVGRLRRQVHTARTPGAADQQAPLRVARRKTAVQRLTTRVGPPRTINTTTQPPAGRSRPSGGIVDPKGSEMSRVEAPMVPTSLPGRMRVLVFGGLALEEVIKADPRWRPTTEGVVAAGDGSPHRQRDCCGDPPHAVRANPRPGGTSMLPENNNAVSCGAADGAIGGSVAKAFARSGARVLLAGRNRRGPVEVATVGSVGAANPAGVPRLGGGS